MSVRVQGVVQLSVRGERHLTPELEVSWTSKAEKLSEVKKVVSNWARGPRGWWGVFVDTTKIHENQTGKIFINNDHSKAYVQFTVLVKADRTPPPVDALFAVDGGRR